MTAPELVELARAAGFPAATQAWPGRAGAWTIADRLGAHLAYLDGPRPRPPYRFRPYGQAPAGK